MRKPDKEHRTCNVHVQLSLQVLSLFEKNLLKDIKLLFDH